MSGQPNSGNPRMNLVRRGLLSWGLVVVAVVVVSLSRTLPAVFRNVGVGPIVATSACMIVIALVVGHFAPTFGLYPTRSTNPPRKPDPIFVSAAVFSAASLWLIGAMLARILVSDKRNALEPGSAEPYLLTLLFILVIAPVTEEILYRGLLQGALNRVFPIAVSVVLSTTIFAVAHPRSRDMILAVAIGLVAGVLREVSGTMLMPILAHIGMNTASWLVPAAAVSDLSHSPAALPVLVLLGGSATIGVVVLIAQRNRSPQCESAA